MRSSLQPVGDLWLAFLACVQLSWMVICKKTVDISMAAVPMLAAALHAPQFLGGSTMPELPISERADELKVTSFLHPCGLAHSTCGEEGKAVCRLAAQCVRGDWAIIPKSSLCAQPHYVARHVHKSSAQFVNDAVLESEQLSSDKEILATSIVEGGAVDCNVVRELFECLPSGVFDPPLAKLAGSEDMMQTYHIYNGASMVNHTLGGHAAMIQDTCVMQHKR
eukprot:2877461-Amphidinium_carterae.2